MKLLTPGELRSMVAAQQSPYQHDQETSSAQSGGMNLLTPEELMSGFAGASLTEYGSSAAFRQAAADQGQERSREQMLTQLNAELANLEGMLGRKVEGRLDDDILGDALRTNIFDEDDPRASGITGMRSLTNEEFRRRFESTLIEAGYDANQILNQHPDAITDAIRRAHKLRFVLDMLQNPEEGARADALMADLREGRMPQSLGEEALERGLGGSDGGLLGFAQLGVNLASTTLRAVMESYNGFEGVLESLNGQPKQGRTYSNTLSGVALGFLPPDRLTDPVDMVLAEHLRHRLAEEHPMVFDGLSHGLAIREQGSFRSLSGLAAGAQSIAGDVIAFLPTALATGGLTSAIQIPGRLAATLILRMSANAALGATEAYVFTPGTRSDRLFSGAFAGGLGVLGDGAGPLVRRMRSNQLSRRAPQTLDLSDPVNVDLHAAIQRGLLNEQDAFARLESGEVTREGLVAEATAVLRGFEAQKEAGQSVEFMQGKPSIYLARSRVRVNQETARIKARMESMYDATEARWMAQNFEDLGGADTVAQDLMRSAAPGTPEFDQAVKIYTQRVHDTVGGRIEAKMLETRKAYPKMADEDLDFLATKLYDFEYQFAVRGVNMDVDVRFADQLMGDDLELLARSHGVEGRGEFPIGGQVDIEFDRGGKTPDGILVKTRKPAKRQGAKKVKAGQPGRIRVGESIPEWARPAMRVKIDIAANQRPGRIAATGVHELAHVWVAAMKDLNPERYARMSEEVGKIYDGLEIGDLDDPLRLAELFVKTLENDTLANGTYRGGQSFIETIESGFRDFSAKFVQGVKDWREQYMQVVVGGPGKKSKRRQNAKFTQVISQSKPFPHLYSDELLQTIKQFRQGNWSELADQYASTKFRRDPSYDIGNTFYDTLDEGVAIRPPKADPSVDVEMMPLRGLKRVPAARNVSPQLRNSVSKINWGLIADAMLSEAEAPAYQFTMGRTTFKGSGGASVRERMREAALWYEKSNAAAPQIIEDAARMLDDIDPDTAAYMRTVSPSTMINALGAQGASRSPDQNLRIALQMLIYQRKVPGGHPADLVTASEAMKGAIIESNQGAFADANAREVLRTMARSGSKAAEKVLQKAANDPQAAGILSQQSFAEWILHNDQWEGGLKLVGYNRSLQLDPRYMAHDIWDQRLFLQDRADMLKGLYSIARGDAQGYVNAAKSLERTSRESSAQARNLTVEADRLKGRLASARRGERVEIEARIADLEDQAKSLGQRGVRVKNADGRMVAYTPSKADYRLMDVVEQRLADILNAREGDSFWNGYRVQAALWSAMRGTVLGDEVGDFGEVAARSLRDTDKNGDVRMAGWLKAAVNAAERDRQDMFVRAATSATNGLGRNHPTNKLHRALADRSIRTATGGLKKNAGTLMADVGHKVGSLNGTYPLELAKIVKTKGMRSRAAQILVDGEQRGATQSFYQGRPNAVAQVGHGVAALNLHRSVYAASIDGSPTRLEGTLNPEVLRDAKGILIEWSESDLPGASAAFEEFKSRVGGRIEVAETVSEAGASATRISFKHVKEVEPLIANLRSTLDDMGATGYLWRGREIVEDVVDGLEGRSQLGSGLRNADWQRRYAQAGGTGRTFGAGAARLAHGNIDAGNVIAAAHLAKGIQGLAPDARGAFLRQYLLGARARLTTMAGLAIDVPAQLRDATADKARINRALATGRPIKFGSKKRKATAADLQRVNDRINELDRLASEGITVEDLQAYRQVADGGALRVLNEVEPELLPSREMFDIIREAKNLRGTPKKALTGARGRALNAATSTLRNANVDRRSLPSTFYSVLDPEDMLDDLADGAEAAAVQRAITGDAEEAVVKETVARSHRAQRHTAKLDDGEPSMGPMMDVVLDAAGGSKIVARQVRSAMNGWYRRHFLNRFERIRGVSDTLSNMMNRVAASDAEAGWFVHRQAEKVLAGLSEQEEALFTRYLIHQKTLIAERRAARTGAKVSDALVALKLSPTEMAAVSESRAIQGALQRHKATVQPQLEAMLERIDPSNRDALLETDSGHFLSLLRYNPEIHGKDVKRTSVRTPGRRGNLQDSLDVDQNSRNMRGFTGTAEEYVTDYREIIRWRASRDVQLANMRDFWRHAEEIGHLVPARELKLVDGVMRDQPAPKPPPVKVNLNGKEVEYKWVEVQLNKRPRWVEIADAEDVDGPPARFKMQHEAYYTLEPIGIDWESYMTSKAVLRSRDRNALQGAADQITGAMLASPIEATRHGLRILDVLAGVAKAPKVRPGQSPRQAILNRENLGENIARFIPYFGVRSRRLMDIMASFDGPNANDLEYLLSTKGGLPNRALPETEEPSFVGNLTRKAGAPFGPRGDKAAEFLVGLTHRGRGLLFDLPDQEAKGFRELWSSVKAGEWGQAAKSFRFGPLLPVPSKLWGFDVRARMVAAEMFLDRLRIEGRIPELPEDPAARSAYYRKLAENTNDWDGELREFLTSFGQFTRGTQTEMVSALKRWRVNPFASAQAGTRPAEVGRILGWDRGPKTQDPVLRNWYRLQTIYGMWIGFAVMHQIANRALSGHWSWENQEGKEFDLDTGLKDEDGSPIYLSGNLIAPASNRALRTLGVRGLFDARKGSGNSIASNPLTDLSGTAAELSARFTNMVQTVPANEAMSLIAGGPPAGFASTLLTGRALHLSRPGELLPVVEPRAGVGRRLAAQAEGAVANLNPIARQVHFGDLGPLGHDALMKRREIQDPNMRGLLAIPNFLFGEVALVGKPDVIEQGTLARVSKRQTAELAFFFVSEYQQARNEKERKHAFERYMDNFRGRSRQEQGEAKAAFFRTLIGLRRSAPRRAAESRRRQR